MAVYQVSFFSEPVEPPPAESEGPEAFVDRVEQRLRTLKTEGNVADVEVLHVVARFHVVVNLNNNKKSKIKNWEKVIEIKNQLNLKVKVTQVQKSVHLYKL